MNIINWFITPKEKILKGDIVLSNEEFTKRLEKAKINRQKVDISGLIYEYKDLGRVLKAYPLGKNYIVKINTGNEYIIDWQFFDKYFAINHSKFTQDYLRNLSIQ